MGKPKISWCSFESSQSLKWFSNEKTYRVLLAGTITVPSIQNALKLWMDAKYRPNFGNSRSCFRTSMIFFWEPDLLRKLAEVADVSGKILDGILASTVSDVIHVKGSIVRSLVGTPSSLQPSWGWMKVSRALRYSGCWACSRARWRISSWGWQLSSRSARSSLSSSSTTMTWCSRSSWYVPVLMFFIGRASKIT